MSNHEFRFEHVIPRPRKKLADGSLTPKTDARLRYSVAYNFEQNGDEFLINYGIAQCNKADNFSRTEGRRIASARLNKAICGKAPPEGFRNSMYGSFVAKNIGNVSIAKLVRERYEADRRVILQQAEVTKQLDAMNELAHELGIRFE